MADAFLLHCPWPEMLSGGQTANRQVLLDDGGQVGTQGQNVAPAMLRVCRLNGNRWRVAFNVEALRHQAGKFIRPQTGVDRDQVENRSIELRSWSSVHPAARRLGANRFRCPESERGFLGQPAGLRA